MSAVKSVVVGTCGLLLLAGCGGATATNKAPGVTVARSTSPTTAGSGSSGGSTEAMKAYVEATANGDNPDAMRSGLKLAAPNSVAYIYLDHLANTAQAALDGGQPYARRQVTPAGSNVFKACSDPANEKTCATLGDFKANADGKLTDLTVNKQPVGQRLTAGTGQVVSAGGAKFTFLTAYKTPASNALLVTLKVETGAQPIKVKTSSATYPGLNGKPRTAQGAMGLTDIKATSSTVIFLAFDLVNVGGRVTLSGCVGKACGGGPLTARIKVG
jgi:hypothetical protein